MTTAPTTTMDPTAANAALPPVRLIGIVCERSVDLDNRMDANGRLLDDPTVKLIQVPCSGLIQPIMMETALKKGAQGCFATGCRIGDCHYRDGNRFLQERLLGKRMPKLKPTVDKRRIEAYWLSAVEYEEFRELIESFQTTVTALETADAAS